jgi:hypothetical protein
MNLTRNEPLAVSAIEAIHKGDVESLQNPLKRNPGRGSAGYRPGVPCRWTD